MIPISRRWEDTRAKPKSRSSGLKPISYTAPGTNAVRRAKPKSRSSGLKPIAIASVRAQRRARQTQIPIIGTETTVSQSHIIYGSSTRQTQIPIIGTETIQFSPDNQQMYGRAKPKSRSSGLKLQKSEADIPHTSSMRAKPKSRSSGLKQEPKIPGLKRDGAPNPNPDHRD